MNLKGIGEEKGTAHRVKILPRLNARHTFCDTGWDVYEGGLGRKEKRDIFFLLSLVRFLYSFPVGVSLPVEEIKRNTQDVGSCLSPHHKIIQVGKTGSGQREGHGLARGPAAWRQEDRPTTPHLGPRPRERGSPDSHSHEKGIS